MNTTTQCPKHAGAFDCTPFCELCHGTQEVKQQTAEEQLETLETSLKHAVHYLSGILSDIAENKYSREDAATDLEAITGNESFGFISDLDTYANGGE